MDGNEQNYCLEVSYNLQGNFFFFFLWFCFVFNFLSRPLLELGVGKNLPNLTHLTKPSDPYIRLLEHIYMYGRIWIQIFYFYFLFEFWVDHGFNVFGRVPAQSAWPFNYISIYYNVKLKVFIFLFFFLFIYLVDLIILRHISCSHNFTSYYFNIYFLI